MLCARRHEFVRATAVRRPAREEKQDGDSAESGSAFAPAVPTHRKAAEYYGSEPDREARTPYGDVEGLRTTLAGA